MNKHMRAVDSDEYHFAIGLSANVVAKQSVPVEIRDIEKCHSYAAIDETDDLTAVEIVLRGVCVNLSGAITSSAALVRTTGVVMVDACEATEV